MIRSVYTKAVVMASLVAGLVLLPSAKAEATFAAYICSVQNCTSGTVVSTTDGGGLDTNGTNGVITLDGNTVGGMTVNINTSLSQPVLAQPALDLTYTVVSTSGGDVWFYATDTDFSVIAPLIAGISATFTGSGALAGSGTVEAFVYGGNSNGQFPLTPQLGSSGVLSSSGVVSTSSTTFAAGLPSVNPFSYTLGLHIVSTGFMSTTGNFGVSGTPIPEPATLSLLGLGLTGIGAAIRRRRKASQNA